MKSLYIVRRKRSPKMVGTISQLYKELETTNFQAILAKNSSIGTRKKERFATVFRKSLLQKNRIAPKNVPKVLYKSYYTLFQKTMRVLLLTGQLIGLIPVHGILSPDPGKIRFTFKSWKFVYSLVICISQGIITLGCLGRLFQVKINILNLAFFSFYSSTTLTSMVFLRIASKWPTLALEISTSELDHYADQRVKHKCNAAIFSFLFLAILEHVLSLISKTSVIWSCSPEETDMYQIYFQENFPWIFELGIPYSPFLGVTLQIINVTSTINWSYSDLFIVCMSLHLTSILEQINQKIESAGKTYLPPSHWRALREDYNKATRLVRVFDDVISSMILISFASNLFFICVQLFNVFGNRVTWKQEPTTTIPCTKQSSGFQGCIDAIYFSFSLAFVVGRFLAVSLVTAKINSVSLVPATSLYNVPSPSYNTEVQRFLDQVHGDIVALTGLQFFYVTKGLILTVAGTIITYELVLLQLNDEDLAGDKDMKT